jgi:SAM-dependent methyltransferase
MKKEAKKNYLDVIYNEKLAPYTSYPDKLTKYLFEFYGMNANMKLLEVGCGRGEFLNGFNNCGLRAFGVDMLPNALIKFPNANIKIADLEKNKLPYPSNSFDVVFSKSVIEHFYYPENIIKEIYRVLKPGGLVITMCPDWKYNYKIYYEDYTHRTPFTELSLKDIHLIHGFNKVHVKKFRQLPIIWKFNFIILFSELTRVMLPNFLKRFKWVKFSKEIMLLASAYKKK